MESTNNQPEMSTVAAAVVVENSQVPFKAKYSLGKYKQASFTKITVNKEKRKKWAAEAKAQYPNKFPLIIERAGEDNRHANGNKGGAAAPRIAEMQNPK